MSLAQFSHYVLIRVTERDTEVEQCLTGVSKFSNTRSYTHCTIFVLPIEMIHGGTLSPSKKVKIEGDIPFPA